MEDKYNVIVGIDPDSKKHGVALYAGGILKDLKMFDTVELIPKLRPFLGEILVSIEDVMSNQFVYARNRKGGNSEQSKIAMQIGRCQQSQVELMRWLDKYEIPYVLHKPQKGNWADNRAQFEKATGWTGQSNADTRSAAYFGFLELKQSQQ